MSDTQEPPRGRDIGSPVVYFDPESNVSYATPVDGFDYDQSIVVTTVEPIAFAPESPADDSNSESDAPTPETQSDTTTTNPDDDATPPPAEPPVVGKS